MSESEEIALSMSENSSAYLITTVAVLGGLVAFYFLKIYDPKAALEVPTIYAVNECF